MEPKNELYAERLRRKAQAAALAAGETKWSDQLDEDTRAKLSIAWDDRTDAPLRIMDRAYLTKFIERRSMRSILKALRPSDMRSTLFTNEDLLSLIEAEHEALLALAAEKKSQEEEPDSTAEYVTAGYVAEVAEDFRADVNHIFLARLVPLHLHHNSQLVEVESEEMHSTVVEPTLHLLHSQSRFADAESAYQNALKELRDHEAGDAITDAATALQDVLKALGCTGNTLGDLLSSARRSGLTKGNDTPLTESIGRTVNWVAAKRNDGEAHHGDPDVEMSEAWMVVHVVGALIIRLSEANLASRT